GAWFLLDRPGEWLLIATLAIGAALGAAARWRGVDERTHLRDAAIAVGVLIAAGVLVAWARSAVVGTPAIERPVSTVLEGRVLERIEQPAEDRVRLVLATREPAEGRAIKVRVNVPLAEDRPALSEGALVRLRARLMPPSPPMLPGAYDFARTAWFQGL